MRRVALISLLAALLMPAAPAFAAPQEGARAMHLYSEIRCLVCQGESIADSQAPIAADMRAQIRADIAQGQSDEQIRKTFYARYGDYVLFRPRWSRLNLILWTLPPLIVLCGIIWLLLRGRKRMESKPYDLTSEEREKLERLLDE